MVSGRWNLPLLCRTDGVAMDAGCRPAVLPVSVDVSGIDMPCICLAEPPAEPFVAPAECRQEFRGPMCLDHIDPELEVIPLLDSGTDCQDEVSSPDGSPMVISPIVGLLPSQGEDDINLTQILPEFGILPAFVTPIVDQYAEGEIPTTECHPPEVPADLFVMPTEPIDGVRSTRDLTVPAFPTPEGMSVFPLQTWRSPPSAEKTAKFRLQSRDQAHSLRERVNAPDVSREGPVDVHRVRHHLATPLRSCQDGQGCPFRITSFDLEIKETDSSQEYGVQLHDPCLLKYVGAPESARLLSRDPVYLVEHMGREKTLSAALQLQHDAGLILSNVQILQQLVTALHGASANVMGAVRGHQPFPTQAMQHVLPSGGVRRAAHYMTAMGLWRPPIAPGIQESLPGAACEACMSCGNCFPEMPQ